MSTIDANSAVELAGRYIALWNETDQDRRRVLIAEGWARDAGYLDPLMAGSGHAGIEALIAGVQRQFPGCRFALVGTPDGHNDRLRFSWSLRSGEGEPVAFGTDFVLVAEDGRIRSVTGFLDQAGGA